MRLNYPALLRWTVSTFVEGPQDCAVSFGEEEGVSGLSLKKLQMRRK